MAGWFLSGKLLLFTTKEPSPYTNNLPHPVASFDPLRTIGRKLENQDYSTVGKLFAFTYRVVSRFYTLFAIRIGLISFILSSYFELFIL